jgi:hypothetical protein
MVVLSLLIAEVSVSVGLSQLNAGTMGGRAPGSDAFFIPSTMRAPWPLTRKIGTMRRVADRNKTPALSPAGWAG